MRDASSSITHSMAVADSLADLDLNVASVNGWRLVERPELNCQRSNEESGIDNEAKTHLVDSNWVRVQLNEGVEKLVGDLLSSLKGSGCK